MSPEELEAAIASYPSDSKERLGAFILKQFFNGVRNQLIEMTRQPDDLRILFDYYRREQVQLNSETVSG